MFWNGAACFKSQTSSWDCKITTTQDNSCQAQHVSDSLTHWYYTSNMTIVTEVWRGSAHLSASTSRPSWVLLQHCIMLRLIFSSSSVLSLHYACIQSSGIIPIPYATLVPNFVSLAAATAELTHGEKLRTQSPTQPAYLMSRNRSVRIDTRTHRLHTDKHSEATLQKI